MICLGPTGNIQGMYNFLSLSSGLVIKRRRFDKLPAPDSVIKWVAALAKNNGESPSPIFTDCYKALFDWLNNNPNDDGLDPTPIPAYPDIHAEMPGVLIDRDTPPTLFPSNSQNYEPDWS